MALTAWLFPGQGSQFPYMGRAAQDAKIFDLAEAKSGLPLRSVMQRGPDELSRRPDFLEPSIVALQITSVDLLRDSGSKPDMVAGYSLGEVGALYCAGCISDEAAIDLAVERGKILGRFSAQGNWRSASVTFREPPVAVPMETVEGVYTACYNSVTDFTITGEEAAVRAAETRLTRSGAAVSKVDIDGPWHSPLAVEVAETCAALAERVHFEPPELPVCLASIGAVDGDAHRLQEALKRNIQAPLLWSKTLDTLWNSGVRSTLEIAPGHTLTGFARSQWKGRAYEARFMEREGGRPFNFEMKEKESL